MNESHVLSPKFFTTLSCGLYSVEDVEATEKDLLEGLSWHISAPTCMQVANHILSWISKYVDVQKSTWATILDEVAFQSERAVREYDFVTTRPSTVAMASIFNAIEYVDEKDREAIIVALVFFMDFEFDSPETLLESKDRLFRMFYDTKTCRS